MQSVTFVEKFFYFSIVILDICKNIVAILHLLKHFFDTKNKKFFRV